MFCFLIGLLMASLDSLVFLFFTLSVLLALKLLGFLS